MLTSPQPLSYKERGLKYFSPFPTREGGRGVRFLDI